MPPSTDVATHRRVPLKSFSGCETCRARKVKCDETRPICKRCAGYFTNPPLCIFREQQPRSRAVRRIPINRQPVRSIGEPGPSLQNPVPNAANLTTNNVALRLFHHYICMMPDQLPQSHNARCRKMWITDVPQLSFDHDYLLSSLLGVAALHIGAYYPQKDVQWTDIAAFYFGRCLTSFDAEVGRLGPKNALPVILTSYFINVLVHRLSHKSAGTFNTPHQEMRLIKGTRPLLLKCAVWLDTTDLKAIVNPETGTRHLPHHRWLQPNEAADLDALLVGLDVNSPEYDIYNDQLLLVRQFQEVAIIGAPQPHLARKATLFILESRDAYIDLLEQRDPRALVIAAHHSALTKFASSQWWLNGYAEVFTPGFANMVPAEWQWAMVWPLWIVQRPEQPEEFYLNFPDRLSYETAVQQQPAVTPSFQQYSADLSRRYERLSASPTLSQTERARAHGARNVVLPEM